MWVGRCVCVCVCVCVPVYVCVPVCVGYGMAFDAVIHRGEAF